MPQPSSSQVHVIDVLLGNISVGYQLDENKFISNRIFPTVPVQKQSDKYLVWDRDAWFRSDAAERAPGTPSVGTGYTFSTDEYYARVYAVHKDIDDQTRANADDVFNLDREATRLVTQQLLIRKDKLWVETYFTPAGSAGSRTSSWRKTMSGVAASPTGDQFIQFDASGSTPIQTLRDEIITIEEATGYRPNTLVLGARVWHTLIDHADFIDRIKYSERALVTTNLLAQVLEIEDVIVTNVVHNTAVEGATLDMEFMAGKHALLLYRTPNAGLMTPSAGYTFAWNGYLGASAVGSRIKRFRLEEIASERIEGEMAFAHKIVADDLGTFFADAVA